MYGERQKNRSKVASIRSLESLRASDRLSEDETVNVVRSVE